LTFWEGKGLGLLLFNIPFNIILLYREIVEKKHRLIIRRKTTNLLHVIIISHTIL